MNSWVTVRTLTSETAEVAPSTGPFVALGADAPRVEIRLHTASLANAPTSVTLAVWRTSEGVIDKIGTFTILSGDIAHPIPQIFELGDGNVYVTVESFAGGASPNLTAVVQARAVFRG